MRCFPILFPQGSFDKSGAQREVSGSRFHRTSFRFQVPGFKFEKEKRQKLTSSLSILRESASSADGLFSLICDNPCKSVVPGLLRSTKAEGQSTKSLTFVSVRAPSWITFSPSFVFLFNREGKGERN
jgi:hypothetical protein